MSALQQFSLRTLFFATLVVAVFCWIFFYLPPPIWATLLWMLALSATVSAVVYGQGDLRAFAIGCIPSLLWWALVTRGGIYRAGVEVELLFALALITALSGMTSICVRRWAERQYKGGKKTAEPMAIPSMGAPFQSDGGPGASVGEKPPIDDEVFLFIEDNRRYWTCSACGDTFISLQMHPACPTCGSLSVEERSPGGEVPSEGVLARRT